jgi:hypothetical protein
MPAAKFPNFKSKLGLAAFNLRSKVSTSNEALVVWIKNDKIINVDRRIFFIFMVIMLQ